MKNVYLFENGSGQGRAPEDWKEHILISGPNVCHEAQAGDIDADGDTGVVIKGWKTGPFVYLENRLVASE